MKSIARHSLFGGSLIFCLAATWVAHADLSIPFADGSDGALIVSSNTTIDLSQAANGTWTNTSVSPGKGTYDPGQWAVVFKYSSVAISNGATLSFSNHPTHAPVVWLVSGSVTINGELSLDGRNDSSPPAEPGPGGFRGGNGSGGGFGPGGGYDRPGYYSTTHPYGNLQVLPLIGGSGGGLAGNFSGGGGGGAILVAASGNITINGFCHANGGSALHFFNSYAGSGGSIRLVASQIFGNSTGTLQAIASGGGDSGRIRLEATNSTPFASVNPNSTVVSPFPLNIWPTNNSPTVQINSISNAVTGLVSVPADPRAAMSSAGDDMTLVTTNSVIIRLTTSNFPTNGIVQLYIKPLDAGQTIVTATNVGGNFAQGFWQVGTTSGFPLNHTILQARAFY